MLRRRRLLTIGFIALLVLAITTLVLLGPSSLAYDTGVKWQEGGTLSYQIDPNLGAALGINQDAAASAINDAANRWNQVSGLMLANPGGYDPNGPRRITTANLADPNSTDCDTNDDMYAVVCFAVVQPGPNEPNPTRFVVSPMYLTSSARYRWNTSGVVNLNEPRAADVHALTMHEFGHWMQLRDHPANHPEAVMSFDATYKPVLTEDDKHGAAMLHGPYTGWEDPNPEGKINQIAYALDVAGYFDDLPPELGPTIDESENLGVAASPFTGSKYERMAGNALASYSYAYYTLFTEEDDTSPFPRRNYLTIQPAMALEWCQYNFQQDTIAVDLEMRDDQGNVTTLRDSGLRDNFGTSVHPAHRGGVYAGNQWNCFSVDLTPLAGRRVTRWLLAYDNGNNGTTGQYRAYFDNLRIVPPVQFQLPPNPTPTPTPKPPAPTPVPPTATPVPPTPTPTPNSACIPNTWSCWTSQGGVLTDAPGAASFNGRVYIFTKGSNSNLWFKSSADGVNYTGWADLGGPLTAAPAAAAFSGRLYAFAKGTDNAIYVKSSADGVNFTSYVSLGGSSDTAPAAASVGGRLYLFSKGGDGAIWYRSSTNGSTWTGWTSLGGVLTAAPAATGFKSRIYVFARGTDNRIYQRSSTDGSSFTAWTVYGDGGVLTSAPAAASYTPVGGLETLYTFATGTDGALYERHTTDGVNYTNWLSLGGPPNGAAAAAGLGGRMYVFARGSADAVYEKHTPR